MSNKTNTGESEKNKVSESPKTETKPKKPIEIGGREGPEPTRYGDWENGGIISDF